MNITLRLFDPTLDKSDVSNLRAQIKKIKEWLKKHDQVAYKAVMADTKRIAGGKKLATAEFKRIGTIEPEDTRDLQESKLHIKRNQAELRKELKEINEKLKNVRVAPKRAKGTLKQFIWKSIEDAPGDRMPSFDGLFSGPASTSREQDEEDLDVNDKDQLVPVSARGPRRKRTKQTQEPQEPKGEALHWKDRNPGFASFVKKVKLYRAAHPDVPYQEVLQIVKHMN